MMLALDRPIFAALRTRQANFAEGGPRALRYRSDVAPFAAAACEDEESLEELASLIGADQSVMLAQAVESPAPPGTIVEALADGLQMVASTVEILDADVRIENLTDADAPEMRELASLTNPGPFLPRTHLLGKFVGIRHLNRLPWLASA